MQISELLYFLVTVLILIGIGAMTSAKGTFKGTIIITLALCGVVVSQLFFPVIKHWELALVAMLMGGIIACLITYKLDAISVPEIITILNGIGGLVTILLALDYCLITDHRNITLMLLGGGIGLVSSIGSVIIFFKLKNSFSFIRSNKWLHWGLFGFLLCCILSIVLISSEKIIFKWLLSSLFFSTFLTLKLRNLQVSIIIAFYNWLTGLAIVVEGIALNNWIIIMSGLMACSMGGILTRSMSKAVNHSILKAILSTPTFLKQDPSPENTGAIKELTVEEAAAQLTAMKKVVLIPGYGMAIAKAQQPMWELAMILKERGVTVQFAIHPAAGRMPGHMNLLLAETGMPHKIIKEMEEINDTFETIDLVIVVGANDIINPAAREEHNSPIYGMPILNVGQAKKIFVLKRGEGKGYAGVDNRLFYQDNCYLIHGDARQLLIKMIKLVINNVG